MKIAVIGRGNIGRTLAEKDHRRSRGHLRRPRPGDQRTAAIPEAVAAAEVVLLAIPGAAAKDLVLDLGEALSGKVVLGDERCRLRQAGCARRARGRRRVVTRRSSRLWAMTRRST